MRNPYQILGVSETASMDEVKKAYRKLSRIYHPDANVNNPNKDQAEAKFKEIQAAYQQIVNEKSMVAVEVSIAVTEREETMVKVIRAITGSSLMVGLRISLAVSVPSVMVGNSTARKVQNPL